MSDTEWIRELIKTEHMLEESGLVEVQPEPHSAEQLKNATLEFMAELKSRFIEAATLFNELKASALGRVKIYGVAKTESDFMLFRNGFKMIFSTPTPGIIQIRFNFINSNYIPDRNTQDTVAFEQETLEFEWGPFAEVKWLYKGQVFNKDALVRYYMSQFIRESQT